MTEQYYETGKQIANNALYYQTIEPNPRLLDYKVFVPAYNMWASATNAEYGVMRMPGGIYAVTTNRAALYFSDDFKVGSRFSFGFGTRMERQDDKELRSQYTNDYVKGRELMNTKFNNNWNHVVTGNFLAKVTNEFGFLGDVVYNDYIDRYYDYSADQRDANGYPINKALSNVPSITRIKVLNFGGGIYYNAGDKFSLVSKINNISKQNVVTSMDVYNGSTRFNAYPIFYDISTFGWTTDIVASPFKN